jgi:hypothetical protein
VGSEIAPATGESMKTSDFGQWMMDITSNGPDA